MNGTNRQESNNQNQQRNQNNGNDGSDDGDGLINPFEVLRR